MFLFGLYKIYIYQNLFLLKRISFNIRLKTVRCRIYNISCCFIKQFFKPLEFLNYIISCRKSQLKIFIVLFI